jgi:D-glucosaminate-6-phosphate ammonia-lyase
VTSAKWPAKSDIYDHLGVTKVINAASWLTALGGSLMRPEVFRAMEEAGQHFVIMDQLYLAAGKVVARACGAEDGMVCAGAAAGNMLMAASVLTGDDDAKIERLPDTTGMKDEILILKSQRNYYDKAFEQTGATLVDVGMPGDAEPYHLEAAITDKTAAVAYINAPFIKRPISLKQVVEIAHARGVPVIVDSSAEVPPIENMTMPMKVGADMVTFSGGKGINGPQNAGLLAGRKDLIAAAHKHYMNPSGSSRASIGRPAKVSKETIVGMVTALELFLETDHAAVWEGWRKQAKYLAGRLQGIPGTRVVVEENENRQGPQAVIYFDPKWKGLAPEKIRQRLKDGNPSIYVGGGGYGDEINLVMVNVQQGEEKIIADRLLEVLGSGKK